MGNFNMQQSVIPQVSQPQQGFSMPKQTSVAAPPSADEIAGGHRALDATMAGLVQLVSKPSGDLTKKDVFDTVSDMIARGAFPTPEAKQKLIGELANLPNDEEGIRKVLGKHLLTIATFQNHFHNAFGAPAQQGMQ